MSDVKPDEYTLFKRRITYVLSYFDEDNEVPWEYVLRTCDGRFEAVITFLLGHLHDNGATAREHSLGCFDTQDEAVKVLIKHSRMVDIADRVRNEVSSVH